MESKSHDDLGSLAASLPVLVYEHGEQPDNYCQTMLSVADRSLRTYQVPEMRNCRCLVTQRGLVLTVDTVSLQSSLWNPQTGEKIALPVMDKPLPEYCRCLLSDAVTSPDCIVLVYDLDQPELLFCQVRGDGSWVSQSYDIGFYKLPESYCPQPKKMIINSMTAVNGKFYFVDSDVIGVLHFAQDPEPHMELSTFDAPMPDLDSEAPQVITMTYLLESSQELFLVCLFFIGCRFERIEEVSAYRMDFSKQEWCKVDDIGNRVFFLGHHNFAASCSAMEHGLKRGRVYFAYEFFEQSTNFHIFDLLEGTREFVGPNQDVPPLARDPFWMVPVPQ